MEQPPHTLKTSVVILNWNGCEMLRRFLPSVVTHSMGSHREICVADNGSTDESVSMLRREFPTVRLILLDRNYGFAEGYNRALEAVNAHYTVLLNSDVEVTAGWLDTLEQFMDAHPEAAACQPKLHSWHRKEPFEYAGAAGGWIDAYGYPFCRGRLLHEVEEDRGQYNQVSPVFWATGAALFIRTHDYRQVGGLDNAFFAHMEEIDLCWRLRARGRAIYCVPTSQVYHVGGGTLQKENPRKTFLNFRNNLLMLHKNLPEARLKPVMRIRTFLDYLAAAVYLLKGQWANARQVLKARQAFARMRPAYDGLRRENLAKTTVHTIPEQFGGSLLWRFYAKGQRTFDRLMFHPNNPY